MSIKFIPDKFLKKIAPEKKIKKLLKDNASVKKTALSFVDDVDFLDKDAILDTALKVSANYKKRIEEDPDIKEDLLEDPKLMIQRVSNEIIFQVFDQIKTKYDGTRAVWLPSSADEPRPEHQLNYGMEYTIGEGIDGVEPGDEYGCQCGTDILTDDTELSL